MSAQLHGAGLASQHDPSLAHSVYDVELLEASVDGIVRLAERCLTSEDAAEIVRKQRAILPLLGDLRRGTEGGRAQPVRGAQALAAGQVDQDSALRGGLPNDNCGRATTISFGTVFGTNTGATSDGVTACGASTDSPDVWYRIRPDDTTYVSFDTLGSDFDTVVSLIRECPDQSVIPQDCFDDTFGTASGGTFYAPAGRDIWIRVAGYGGSTGNFALTLKDGSAIQGTVTSRAPTEPVKGSVQVVDDEGYMVRTTDIGPNGEYLVGADVGHRFVKTLTDGHFDQLHEGVECLPDCPTWMGTAVAVGASFDTTVDFDLDTAGSIAGLVTSGGTPLAGVRMEARRALGNGRYTTETSEYTDQAGAYEFTSMTPGSYQVFARATLHVDEFFDDVPCEYGCEAAAPLEIELVRSTRIGGVDFDLFELPRVTGMVEDQTNGGPLSGAAVRALDETGREVVTGYSQPDGSFSMGLAPGSYFLKIQRSGYATRNHLGEPFSMDPADAFVVPEPPAGAPVVEVALPQLPRVQVHLSDGVNSILGSVTVFDDNREPVAFAQHLLSTAPLDLYLPEAGSYYVFADGFRAFGELWTDVPCWDGYESCDLTGAQQLALDFGDLEVLNWDLTATPKISGVVRDEFGTPRYDAAVALYQDGERIRSVRTNEDGIFAFSVLPGTYTASAALYRHQTQWFDAIDCPSGDCDPEAATPIVVAGTQSVTGVDFALEKLESTIEGLVSLEEGEADYVRVYAKEVGSEFAYESSVTVSWPTLVGAAHWEMFLPPGDYVVWAAAYDHLGEIWEGIPCGATCAGDAESGTVIPLSSDEHVLGVDLVLRTGGTIEVTGRLSERGEPLGISVDLYSASGERLDTRYGESEVAFGGLEDGTYFVVVRSDSNRRLPTANGNVYCDECDPTTTQAVQVSGGGTSAVEIDLLPAGSLRAALSAEDEGDLGQVVVRLYRAEFDGDGWDIVNSYQAVAFSNPWEAMFEGLKPGTYFLTFDSSNSGYLDGSFDGLPCVGGHPVGCNATKGTPVAVGIGQLAEVEILVARRSTGGTSTVDGVVQDTNGIRIGGAILDIWSDSGGYLTSGATDFWGRFDFFLPPGTYYVSTETQRRYVDEIYDGVECFGGSAFVGACDPTTGTAVVVDPSGARVTIDFFLEPDFEVFADGFESGGTATWN